MNKKNQIIIILSIISLMAILMLAIQLINGPFLNGTSMTAEIEMRQVIQNHGSPYDYLSPNPKVYYSELGFIYLITIPYGLIGSLLGFAGIVYLIKILFTILGIITVYLFAKKIALSEKAGILASLIFAFSQIFIIANGFNEWTAEGLSPIMLMFSVLLLLYFIEEKDYKKKALFIGLSLMGLAFSYKLWTGGIFGIAAYGFICMILFLNNYIKSSKKLITIISILVSASWIIFSTTSILSPLGLSTKIINVGFPSLSQLELSSLQVMAQIIQTPYPSSKLNLYYYFISGSLIKKLPYIINLIAGFICTTFLALLSVLKLAKKKEGNKAFIAVIGLAIFGIPMALYGYLTIIGLPIIILAGSSIAFFEGRRLLLVMTFFMIGFMIMLSFMLIQIYFSGNWISEPIIVASSWIKNNTSSNATFLSQDIIGTQLEFYANRTNLIDFNVNDNPFLIQHFYQFLLSERYNFSFLEQQKPDYILVEDYWYYEPTPDWINSEANITYQITANQTNLYLLTRNYPQIVANNIRMDLVYAVNQTTIYKVNYS